MEIKELQTTQTLQEKWQETNNGVENTTQESSLMHVSPSASNRLNMTINYIILTLRISRQIDEVVSL
jgi:hypothetical protein